MSEKLIVVLCEGVHDAAFLGRILEAGGWNKYEKKLGLLPEPAKSLFANPKFLDSSVIEEQKLKAAHENSLPFSIFHRDRSFVFFFVLRGDKQDRNRKKLIEAFRLGTRASDEKIIIGPPIKCSFLYFFDADDDLVAKRMEEIRVEIATITQSECPTLENGKVVDLGDNHWGGFIFTSEAGETGRLEDVLLYLMRQDNEDLLARAESFLTSHRDFSIFATDQTIFDEGAIHPKKVFGSNFDSQKSLVGTVGQLQISGCANTVIIRDTALLNDSKIKENGVCMAILGFINAGAE